MHGLPLCGCGCGAPVKLTRSGRPNQFIHGHALRGKPKSEEHRRKLSAAAKGRPGIWLGKRMPLTARLKMSAAKRGGTLTLEHRRKIAASMIGKPHPCVHPKQTLATRLKKRLAQLGPKGPNWKGGISPINDRIRRSMEYREWRVAVFRRDKFTCQQCGAHTGTGHRVYLHAHHVKPFAEFPSLRFEVSNGLTLCKTCHDRLHGRSK